MQIVGKRRARVWEATVSEANGNIGKGREKKKIMAIITMQKETAALVRIPPFLPSPPDPQF